MSAGDETRSHFESAAIRDALRAFFGSVQGLRNGPTDIDNTDVKVVVDLAQLLGVPINVVVNPGPPLVTPYVNVQGELADWGGLQGTVGNNARVVGPQAVPTGDYIDNANEKDTWIQTVDLELSIDVEDIGVIADQPVFVDLVLHNPDAVQKYVIRSWQGRKDWMFGFFDEDTELAKMFFHVNPHNAIGQQLNGSSIPAGAFPNHQPSMEYGPSRPIFVPGAFQLGEPGYLEFRIALGQEGTAGEEISWPATTLLTVRGQGYQPVTAGQLINFL